MANTPNLGYNKIVDSDSVEETHNIPITKNILPHEADWLTHNKETSSLSDTSPLAVKTVISPDANQYVAKHDLSQHNNVLDYSTINIMSAAAL
jgi:hypothetical protein